MSFHSPELSDSRLTRRACLGWGAASLVGTVAARAGCPCADDGNAPASAPPTSAENPAADVLRVCCDPNNLPFSNRNHEGFEDKIAELVAGDLGMKLDYQWLPQRLGFWRESLKNGDANLVMAAPAGFERALTTRPYYRSSYVFVCRKKTGPVVRSFDDPALARAKIGVQLTGGANTPPALELGRRGLIDNVTGYPVFDASDGRPSEKIIAAVADGEIDVAVAWGPPAGYFAKQQHVPLELTPVSPARTPSGLYFAFNICMGLRRSDKELRDKINDVLSRRQAQIEHILDHYGVPRLPIVTQSEHADRADHDGK